MLMRLPRPTRRFARLLTGGVLLALQTAIAGSWVVEPVNPVRPDHHAEDYGARHLDLHNESNCLACAARAMHAAPATLQGVALAAPIERRTDPTAQTVPHARLTTGTNRSRAPPAS